MRRSGFLCELLRLCSRDDRDDFDVHELGPVFAPGGQVVGGGAFHDLPAGGEGGVGPRAHDADVWGQAAAVGG